MISKTKSNDNSCPRVIVSLTSFPAAIPYAMGAVRSLLAGKVLPDRIVLYVTLSQFGFEGLPDELLALERENEIFEIRDYDRDIRSYRKLIPALKDFPDDIIVTVDDDVAYHPDMLGRLLKTHEKWPGHVIAHRAKKISSGKPYKKWKKYRWYHFLANKFQPAYSNMQTGVGGVLYPPHSLKENMLDEKLFSKIAPTADDLWFWAAAVANGTKILPVPYGINKPKGLGKPKNLSLKTVNFKSGVDRNAEALAAILQKYTIVRERLNESV